MSRSIFAIVFAMVIVQVLGSWTEVHAKNKSLPKAIKVVTVTEDGGFIRAKIRIKSFPDPEKDAYVLRDGQGFKVISVDKCDDLVSISAVPETVGIVRKTADNVPDWLACKEPELTFNDFVIVPLTVSISNPELMQTEFWSKTLGATAVKFDPKLPQNIADAFAKQEYGKISIIATELERPIRAAGKVGEANFLYSIAIDAGARGVLASAGKPVDPTTTDILEYSPDNNRFELKTGVKSMVKDYQIKNLGFAADTKNLGKFTWQTMKSLPGGDDVYAPQYQLRPDAVANFDGQLLQKLRAPEL
ncbi:hypothetical protein ACVIEM_006555 [Rhizobium leguminosarum]